MTVVEWAETNWILPETRRPIVLQPWQRETLLAIFPPDGSPSPHETFLISTVKKAGKTELNAVATLYAALTFPAPETVFAVANDLEQAQERVFERIAKAARAIGLVRRRAAVVSKSEIVFPETGSRIVAVPADFAGAAGAVFGITSWTELWAYRHEGHVRLWEELTPIPNRRSLRIVDSYAGFAGDAPILEAVWQRALEGERIHDELPIYTSGKLWAFIDQGEEAQRRGWLGDPRAMGDYYAEQAATLRPGTYARLHLNLWQSGEEAFIDAASWDACVDPALTPELVRHPADPVPRVFVGIDAAVKGDSAAVVAVTHDGDRLRLVHHRVWQPSKADPLDLEATIEAYVLELRSRFTIESANFDPYQMHRSAAALRANGVRMTEMPQTSANLTAAGQNLFELIRARKLHLYPDDELRRHALNAVAIESGRGWRLSKEKASRKSTRSSRSPSPAWPRSSVLQRRPGRWRAWAGTKHGRRDVRLSAGLARLLWEARKTAADGRDEGLVFPAASGGFLDRHQVFRAVKDAAKRAGVPWAGLHTLRHTAATIRFRRGWNAVQVQKFMGHHSPAFTLATYVHLLPEDLPDDDFSDGLLGVAEWTPVELEVESLAGEDRARRLPGSKRPATTATSAAMGRVR